MVTSEAEAIKKTSKSKIASLRTQMTQLSQQNRPTLFKSASPFKFSKLTKSVSPAQKPQIKRPIVNKKK